MGLENFGLHHGAPRLVMLCYTRCVEQKKEALPFK
jgi:hypothetical protein